MPTLGEQPAVLTEPHPQRAHRLVDHRGLVGAEKDQIPVDRRGAGHDGIDRTVRQELEDRRLQAIATLLRPGVDLDIGQTLRAVDADELGVAIDLLARELAAVRQAKGHHAPLGILRRLGEDLEVDPGHQVGDIDQLERHAQIRTIRAEAAHRLGIGQPREGIGQLHTLNIAEERTHHGLHDRHQLVLGHEGDLDVELGKLGLAIGAQILVPEAAGDLIIAVHTGHHEQLLEELR